MHKNGTKTNLYSMKKIIIKKKNIVHNNKEDFFLKRMGAQKCMRHLRYIILKPKSTRIKCFHTFFLLIKCVHIFFY